MKKARRLRLKKRLRRNKRRALRRMEWMQIPEGTIVGMEVYDDHMLVRGTKGNYRVTADGPSWKMQKI